jgi:hypothetical protein
LILTKVQAAKHEAYRTKLLRRDRYFFGPRDTGIARDNAKGGSRALVRVLMSVRNGTGVASGRGQFTPSKSDGAVERGSV